MTARERRERRRMIRRRRQTLTLSALLIVLVLIVLMRAGYEGAAEDKLGAAPATVHTAEIITPPRATMLPAASAKPSTTPAAEEKPESRYSEIEISKDDIYTLACLVWHEARGEPFEGQVAVIEVVLNRILSDRFPDTVEEVVFQKLGETWQFSPAPILWTAEPEAQQYEAVETAIQSAENVLPVETVFFSGAPYNENIVAVIGGHYFCTIEEVTGNE